MGITYQGEDKNTNRTATTNDKGVTTSTRGYLFTASEVVSEFAIGNHASCPRIGSTHPDNAGLWAIGVSIENHEPYAGWRVVVNYSSEREFRDNPLDDPIRIGFDDEQFQKPLIKDEDGNAILNSAGDPYDPPPLIDDCRIAANVTMNLPGIPSWWLTHKDCTNEDVFTIRGLSVPIGVAKLQRRSISDWQYRNGVAYMEVSLTIHFDEDGWNTKPLNAGFRRIYTGSGAAAKRELITIENSDGDKEYPPAPVPLDENGVDLVDPTPETVTYGDFRGYKKKPFSVFGFE